MSVVVKNITILLLPAILAFSCNTSVEPESEGCNTLKINITEAIHNQKDIKLSDIADSISYIRLETVKERPIRNIYYFAFFRNDIFINGGTRTGMIHYDGKGKFLNTVSSAGGGKGQYLPGSDFSVNGNSRRIYVLTKFSPRKIMVFDYSGYLLSEFRVTVPTFGGFEAISDNRFLFLAGPMEQENGNAEYMARLMDRNDNNLSEIKSSQPSYGFNMIKSVNYYGVVSGRYFEGAPLFYYGNSMDTVYSVKNDSIYPRYIIVRNTDASSNLPSNLKYSDTLNEGSGMYLIPSAFAETPMNVFLTFVYGDSSYVAAYDKQTNTISSMRSRFDERDMENNPPALFRNDIDGGLSVTTGKSDRQGNVWIYIYTSSYFRNSILSANQGSRMLYPEKQKKLRKFAASLPDSEDPVIMAVYLKRSPK